MEMSRVISEDGLSVTNDRLRIDIRLPWYRSLPLSTVELGRLSLDGKAVDLARVQFELEGVQYPVTSLPDLVDKVWYVLDSAFLIVDDARAAVRMPLEVDLALNLYPPYIQGLKRVALDRKTLVAK